MLRRHWLHRVAFRECLIAAVLITSPFPPQQQNSAGYGSASHAAESEKDDRIVSTHFAPGYRVDDDTYRVICDQPKDKDHADLCQQWRMAAAAETQLWMNGAGLILLIGTLAFTARAARAARDAANAAKEAADAANSSAISDREANELIRTNAQLELRAYLSAVPAGVNQLIGVAAGIGHVDVRNVGKLPARNVSVYVRIKISDEREADFPVPADTQSATRVIQPGAEMRQGSDELNLRTIIDGQGYVFVWGVVYYEDGYSRRRFTRFCHRYAIEAVNRHVAWLLDPALETRRIIDSDKARYHETGNEAD
jgi:hypothetical protein